MNDGDVFVLEAMSHIFIWVGRKANRLERLQGCKVHHITYWAGKKTFTQNISLVITDLYFVLKYLLLFICDKFASKLKEENCKAEVVNVMDGEERTMHSSEKKVFNEFLLISDKKVNCPWFDDLTSIMTIK